jgi:tRNA nucleotidyltransferase (CCA-adding enzyme)
MLPLTTPADPPAGSWEHFPHDADVGIRGRGPTKAVAFEQAALALSAVVTDPGRIRPTEPVTINCEGADDEMLLIEWLDALIYQMATRRMLFGEFKVDLFPGGLRATARGEPLDLTRHEPTVEVKGATFAELRVRREPDGRWLAQCIVDV